MPRAPAWPARSSSSPESAEGGGRPNDWRHRRRAPGCVGAADRASLGRPSTRRGPRRARQARPRRPAARPRPPRRRDDAAPRPPGARRPPRLDHQPHRPDSRLHPGPWAARRRGRGGPRAAVRGPAAGRGRVAAAVARHGGRLRVARGCPGFVIDFTFLARGIGLGFAIAAAVGPISLLTIRRTIAHGQAYGLASGAGVALADATYAGIAAFGLTAITSVLVGGRAILGVIGGSFIVLLGIRTIATRPDAEAAAETTHRPGLPAAFASI